MKKVNLFIKKHHNGATVVGLNDYLISGVFPNSATTIIDLNIPMENIAKAFSVEDLEEMLKSRKKL